MALKSFKKADGTTTTTTSSTMDTTSLVGIAIGVGVLFATIWVISKAWKVGQK